MKIFTFLTVTAALSLCACDSKQEQAREQTLENRADRLEDQAKVTKKAGEADAEALKKEADRTREQK